MRVFKYIKGAGTSDYEEFEEIEKDDYEDDDGEEYISGSESQFLREWQAIYKAAESNVALKKAIERVKVTYHLSKQYGNSKT